jgi:23S rRNA (uracil1939-C5)-methyltransferase
LGFFKKRSREIVDVKNCLVAHPKINEALKELRGTLDANSPRTKVELFIDEQGALHKSENNPHSAQGFRQIHEEQNLNLRHTVRKMVENSQSEKVLELFSGDGNLTASYLDLVEQVLSVEGASHSIEKAKQAVESDKVQYLQDFITIKLRKKIPREFRNSYDTLLLDPPRSGLGFDLSSLVHSDLKSIIYVSCSLVEFAKDVQCLKDSYQLEEVQPLDMFPQTRHVEIVARFSKVSS